MYKVAVIEEIDNDGIELFKKHPKFEYEIISDFSEQNLKEKLPDFDACTLRTTKLFENILINCKKLKVISRHGVGIDNVDLNFIKKNNISLLITAKANAISVSEHVMSLILSISKNLHAYNSDVKKGNFKQNAHLLESFELDKKKILIVGFGRIGKNLIKKCLAFNMNVMVYDPFVDESIIKKHGGNKIKDFYSEITKVDYLSLHLPLNEKTKNMINYKTLQSMKKSSIIINTARGGIINEIDLDKALNEKLIFGAGLDVYETEPVKKSNPLLKNNKVILTPHSATFTNECKSKMGMETAQNIIDFFENKIDDSMVVKL